MSPRRLALALALAALPAGTALAAGTAIVPGRSIGPVALGDERVPVEAAVGPGTVLRRLPGPIPRLPREVVAYPRAGLQVTFPTPEASTGATRISTDAPRYRTARGAGVGSGRAAVRRAHPGARCGPRSCVLATRRGGRVVQTRFALEGGVVYRVTLVVLPPR